MEVDDFIYVFRRLEFEPGMKRKTFSYCLQKKDYCGRADTGRSYQTNTHPREAGKREEE